MPDLNPHHSHRIPHRHSHESGNPDPPAFLNPLFLRITVSKPLAICDSPAGCPLNSIPIPPDYVTIALN